MGKCPQVKGKARQTPGGSNLAQSACLEGHNPFNCLPGSLNKPIQKLVLPVFNCLFLTAILIDRDLQGQHKLCKCHLNPSGEIRATLYSIRCLQLCRQRRTSASIGGLPSTVRKTFLQQARMSHQVMRQGVYHWECRDTYTHLRLPLLQMTLVLSGLGTMVRMLHEQPSCCVQPHKAALCFALSKPWHIQHMSFCLAAASLAKSYIGMGNPFLDRSLQDRICVSLDFCCVEPIFDFISCALCTISR